MLISTKKESGFAGVGDEGIAEGVGGQDERGQDEGGPEGGSKGRKREGR